MRELDRIDRKILGILQQQGRISTTELSERVSLSATPCAERIKRMEREGVISGYHARIDPRALGLGMLVFVEIILAAKSDDIFETVKRELRGIPEVLECHLVSGNFDYLIKARIGEMSEYRRLLGDILKKLPASAESRSYIVMEEIKESLCLPLDARMKPQIRSSLSQ
ncbi:MAG: winged helix-turn-helix transcriptional regulator [Rhodocyclaceae bacterium]|nr:MAG: winged helix-turn-helix transcriptional regulator [Rhodocyclaceae bacterium]